MVRRDRFGRIVTVEPPTPVEITEFGHSEFPALAEAGVVCDEAERGTVIVRWPLDERQLRPGNYISGVTQFMIADVALWYATFTLIGLEPMAVTSDLQITYLRPAMGADLMGRATIVSESRRKVHGIVSLWVGADDTRLVSHATGSYALPAQI